MLEADCQIGGTIRSCGETYCWCGNLTVNVLGLIFDVKKRKCNLGELMPDIRCGGLTVDVRWGYQLLMWINKLLMWRNQPVMWEGGLTIDVAVFLLMWESTIDAGGLTIEFGWLTGWTKFWYRENDHWCRETDCWCGSDQLLTCTNKPLLWWGTDHWCGGINW